MDLEECKNTWQLMEKFMTSIEEIQDYPIKINTILINTPSFRKNLAEIPRLIISSI
jgi:hypothetical protein